MKHIAQLSLQDWDGHSADSPFVRDLMHSFRTTGFVAIRDHGIAAESIASFYALCQRFFDLPSAIKEAYELPELAGQRGYTSFGKEHAKDSEAPDLKEFWQIGQPDPPQDATGFHKLPNVDVAELPDLMQAGEQLFMAFETSGTVLLKAVALGLGMDLEFFTPWAVKGNSILRAIHYPALEQHPEGAVRAAAHEDINLITLLVGASAKGLELKHSDGSWLPVDVDEQHIVVNVGDMLQRLTNGLLPSVTHRVVNPAGNQFLEPRYSIPFFLHPRPEMPLDVLDACVSDERPRQFEPITAGDYLVQRLKEIGLLT